MEDVEELVREVLSYSDLEITKRSAFIFDNIDSFVALSRDNTSIETLDLYPFDSDAGNYEVWDKVGQMVGNLMELQVINIHFSHHIYFIDEPPPIPDWETLTRILGHVQRKVKLHLRTEEYDADVEEIQGLARAIRGHPMISEFSSRVGLTFASVSPLYSALVTLPSLESVSLGLEEPDAEDQLLLLNPELLTELLRAPALRYVIFVDFSFTNELCHATANALEEGSSVIDFAFDYNCSFPDGGRAIIANALKTNVSVTDAAFLGDFDEAFLNSLAGVLLCSSTLHNLTVDTTTPTMDRGYSTMFLSLGMNTTLKSLSASICNKFGDTLCAAIRSGLAKNSTLEELSLDDMVPSDDDGAASARNALSFLCTNSTLKSLQVSFRKPFVQAQMESYVSAFRLEAVKMMENTFLESLTIHNSASGKFEELFALISALELNTTLKTLGHNVFFESLESHYLSDDEANRLVSILMKNYGLECLVPDISCAYAGTIQAILRLNKAGRRYLIEDGSSISKGVDVLSAVNDDINCLFLHLLENPGLCNRRAVETETTTRRRRPGDNLDESSISRKRERAQSQPDKEPRRRLA
jgi:hypothetical protein